MHPWRPGNENFPVASVQKTTQNEGEKDSDDSHVPTINVHYDFKPPDFLSREKKANDTTELRHYLLSARTKYAEDKENMLKAILNEHKITSKLFLETVKQGAATRDRVGGVVSRAFLPEEIATGTILGTSAMNKIYEQIDKEWRKKASPDMLKNQVISEDFWFTGSTLSQNENIFSNLAEQYIST